MRYSSENVLLPEEVVLCQTKARPGAGMNRAS